jgi:polyisoprenoid-binding protein YceI
MNKRTAAKFGLAIIMTIVVNLTPPSMAAEEVYKIDSVHSSVNFKVRHLLSYTSGRFTDFSGVLNYNDANPEASQIEFSIQTASIDTGNENRDGHLRNSDFFDVESYPAITFKSKTIKKSKGENMYEVAGDLSMHGVTKEVAVEVEMLGFGEFPGMGKRGGFNVTAKINRKEFGMTWNKLLEAGGTVIGEDIQIDCPLEVIKVESTTDVVNKG